MKKDLERNQKLSSQRYPDIETLESRNKARSISRNASGDLENFWCL